MSYKPDEATLISYLYGELEGDEVKMVEEYLEKNPVEKKRLEEWAFARSAMKSLGDKEVIAPPIFVGGEGRSIPFWKQNYFRMPLGIAASFVFILVAAKILGLSIGYSNDELRISFGEKQAKVAPGLTKVAPGLTKDEVREMIGESLASNNQILQASWTEDRKQMVESVKKNLSTSPGKINELMKKASVANEDEIRRFVAQMQNDNLKLLKEYVQLSSAGQRQYVEGLLVDFAKYLQEQRNQDIEFFQTRMNTVEKNTDQLKQETEEILTSLVSNNMNNQKRN
ncbi:MAG TPA: hypothetical protein VG737_09210 [Cyclobacteriaceae bacterium]|nr:hypothetical protein [Cyclobacteriaceae bacterium]